MSRRDKIKIAELEAKLYVYEMVIAASGMKTLEKKVKVKKPEMGFVGRK